MGTTNKVTSFLSCSGCSGTIYGAGETEDEAIKNADERFEVHVKWHKSLQLKKVTK